jgi:hypothetical protein
MTIRDFLRSLGGPTLVAGALSTQTGEAVSRVRVAMWASYDHVPHRWRAPLVRLARARGLTVPRMVSDGVIVEMDKRVGAVK